jgi:hypothetical protein
MFKGRALLIIDRLHTDSPNEFHWDIDVRQLTINQDDPGGEVAEAFSCAEYDVISAPPAAYRMQVGDRIRVLVHYEIHFSYDSWSGEHDMELYYERTRVLRRQPYNERRDRARNYSAWKDAR